MTSLADGHLKHVVTYVGLQIVRLMSCFTRYLTKGRNTGLCFRRRLLTTPRYATVSNVLDLPIVDSMNHASLLMALANLEMETSSKPLERS